MRQLILLYWGCVFLMYLSQVYYPTSMQLEGPQTGRCHFMLRKADVFMIAAIVWMTCFSFLRTSYNDTGTYIAHFMDSESVADYFARNGLLDWTGNPLSELYRDAMRDITTMLFIPFQRDLSQTTFLPVQQRPRATALGERFQRIINCARC